MEHRGGGRWGKSRGSAQDPSPLVTAADPSKQRSRRRGSRHNFSISAEQETGQRHWWAETVPPTVVTPTTPRAPLPLATAAVTANQTTLDKTKVPAVPVPLVVTPVTPVLPAAPRH